MASASRPAGGAVIGRGGGGGGQGGGGRLAGGGGGGSACTGVIADGAARRARRGLPIPGRARPAGRRNRCAPSDPARRRRPYCRPVAPGSSSAPCDER